MAFPYTMAAKLSQFPYRFLWNESSALRYVTYAAIFVVGPLYWKMDQFLTSPENKALWKEKRAHDREHHRKELEKMWEVRT